MPYLNKLLGYMCAKNVLILSVSLYEKTELYMIML